jgi:hypothetical protein
VIRILRDGTYDGSEATVEEIAELDRTLERVAPDVLRWRAADPEPPPMRGAGDLVKRVTDWVGLKQCEPCKARQDWLNEKLPFRAP